MAEIWADVGLVSWIQRVVWRIESEFGNKNKPTSEISPNSLLFSLFGHSFLGLIHRSSHFRSFAQSFSRFGNLISELHWFIQFFNQIYAFWHQTSARINLNSFISVKQNFELKLKWIWINCLRAQFETNECVVPESIPARKNQQQMKCASQASFPVSSSSHFCF